MNTFEHCSPEAAGISSSALLGVMKKLSALEYVNSVIMLRHGKVFLEGWNKPYTREMPHQLFSLSKSFTSCAIGLAQAEGKLKITDKLISFFPEYDSVVTDPKMRQVTLEDLLTMRSGHHQCATCYQFGRQNYVKEFLASPLKYEPGTRFVYNSAGSYMLASVIRKVMGQNVREYLIPRLFEPLEIAPGPWLCCPMGTNLGGWGLHLTTDDIAKFAQLILQHGKWNGKQILPADYLAAATSKHADNSMNGWADWKTGYGYHFWMSRHGYRGDGASGQYFVILEKEDIAIAVTSCLDEMFQILDVFWDDLLPALHDDALPENVQAKKELDDFLNDMSIPPLKGDLTRRHAPVMFRFQANPASVKSCEVTFSTNACALTFVTDRGAEQLRAGFGYYETCLFQLTDEQPHFASSSAAWLDDHTLQINTVITDGIYRDIWTIDFNDPVEPLKHRGKCGCFRPTKPQFLLDNNK